MSQSQKEPALPVVALTENGSNGNGTRLLLTWSKLPSWASVGDCSSSSSNVEAGRGEPPPSAAAAAAAAAASASRPPTHQCCIALH